MKQPFNLNGIFLFLFFIISSGIWYFYATNYLGFDITNFGIGATVMMGVWLFLWGIIFLYFFVRKLFSTTSVSIVWTFLSAVIIGFFVYYLLK